MRNSEISCSVLPFLTNWSTISPTTEMNCGGKNGTCKLTKHDVVLRVI